MSLRFTELHCKEVICVATGQRLGYVVDVLVELPEGKIAAIIVPGPCRFFGLAGREDDLLIPWCKICRIGPDIILVDIQPEKCRVPRLRREWPFCRKP